MAFEILASGYGLVEGPTEDAEGAIVFSDVLGGGVYRVDRGGAVTTLVPKRRGVGGIALHADGGVVCSGRDIVHVRDGVTRTLFSIPGLPGWNDLCTDAAGRVYAGALRFAVFDPNAQPMPGECYRIDKEGDAQLVYGGVLHANGIALSPDGRTIYHSDTRAGVIFVHDLDRAGNATARRTWAMAGGQPDGLAVDALGGVWVASAGGGRVDRYRPRWPRRAQPRGARADRHERVLRGPRPLRPDRHHRGSRGAARSARLRAAHARRRRGCAGVSRADLTVSPTTQEEIMKKSVDAMVMATRDGMDREQWIGAGGVRRQARRQGRRRRRSARAQRRRTAHQGDAEDLRRRALRPGADHQRRRRDQLEPAAARASGDEARPRRGHGLGRLRGGHRGQQLARGARGAEAQAGPRSSGCSTSSARWPRATRSTSISARTAPRASRTRASRRESIPGADLQRALLKIWLGKNPVQDDLKAALLKGG